MAKRGRPTVEITLSGNERRQLESWARRHSSAQSLALRCKIILACSDPELSRQEIADRVGCNPATVTKWRNRFAQQRLDGLIDEPRPGAERTIGDEVVEAVVIDTLESAPADATHWSTRALAAKHGISRQTVSEIWRAFGLKPWRQDEFKVSPDPQLVEKIRDLVGLYLNPPVNAAVFAVDEKPQIQALNRTAPILPMLPTTPQRRSHDYQRNGTIDLFAALEWGAPRFPDSGSSIGFVERNGDDGCKAWEVFCGVQVFIWTKTADQILERLARYCAAITGTKINDAST